MYHPSVFCVKLQLHFGGDVHEISVPAYGGAEPTVTDLMNVVEQNFRVPRALQNLVFHGQDLHTWPYESLSRFGIKNGCIVRLVGRMAPPDMIPKINSQYQTNVVTTFHTTQQSVPYYAQPYPYTQNPSVAVQYEPPHPATPVTNTQQPPPPPTPAQRNVSQQSNVDDRKSIATPNSSSAK